MKEYLLLFHSTAGVIQTRRTLQAAGMTFHVSNVPHNLHDGCGLCIWLTCPPGREIQWVVPGHTGSVYCQQGGGWRCITYYGIPPRQGLIKIAMYTLRYPIDLS